MAEHDWPTAQGAHRLSVGHLGQRVFLPVADKFPDRVALHIDLATHAHDELPLWSGHLAAPLVSEGVRADQVVVISMRGPCTLSPLRWRCCGRAQSPIP